MLKQLHKLASKAGFSLGGHKACLKYRCKKYCGYNPAEAQLFYSGGFGKWVADSTTVLNGKEINVDGGNDMSAAEVVLLKEKKNLLKIIEMRKQDIADLENLIKNYHEVIEGRTFDIQEIDKALVRLG